MISPAWMPRLLSRDYDPRIAAHRAETRRADRHGHDREAGRLGCAGEHDARRAQPAQRVLAGIPAHRAQVVFLGAACAMPSSSSRRRRAAFRAFFVPRLLPDGTRNAICYPATEGQARQPLQRLERSRVRRHLWPRWWESEGRGIPTILEMGVYTRLDCAHRHGRHHASVRRAGAFITRGIGSAFGRLLIEQPLMKNVLADLALECEAAIALALRLARAFDAQQDEAESALRRVLTPVAKYWICKRGPRRRRRGDGSAGRQRLRRGGSDRARLPRIAGQLASGKALATSCAWTCSGPCRASRARFDALAALLQGSGGRDARYDQYVARLLDDLRLAAGGEATARVLTERIALAAQASVLLEGGAASVAEAFISSRIVSGAPAAFGTLPAGLRSWRSDRAGIALTCRASAARRESGRGARTRLALTRSSLAAR